MSKKIYLLFPLIVCSFLLSAQEDSNSLKDQFIKTIDKSNSFQHYKVIEKAKLQTLRNNVMDSVSALQLVITTANEKINEQQGNISQLSSDLSSTQESLVLSKQKEDGIALMGSLTKKSTYNAIMWSTIGFLLIILVFLLIKFKRSNYITKEAKLKLVDMESEFEAHRQKTLESEQILRRKLQDEINKNRNV